MKRVAQILPYENLPKKIYGGTYKGVRDGNGRARALATAGFKN